MESRNTILLNPEDFEDFHKLAAKLFGRDPSLPGRPTKEEQEFRSFLADFEKFRLLKSTGAFDKFFSELTPDSQRPFERKRDKTRKAQNREAREAQSPQKAQENGETKEDA